MIKQENTYLGADGFAYCKICGEPVEAYFPPDSILGMKKHFRQCACIRQKREAEEKAYKEREHCELVERNRKICFEESRMYDWKELHSRLHCQRTFESGNYCEDDKF